jgi:hypothetical protein
VLLSLQNVNRMSHGKANWLEVSAGQLNRDVSGTCPRRTVRQLGQATDHCRLGQ